MVDGKTGGLRAAPRINSVSSTIRLFNLRPLRTRFSPTFPPSYARCFRCASSRSFFELLEKGDTIISRRWWRWWVHCTSGNLNPHLLSNVPFPSRNLVAISASRLEKTRGIIIGGMRRAEEKGKSCGWWREKRKEGEKK